VIAYVAARCEGILCLRRLHWRLRLALVLTPSLISYLLISHECTSVDNTTTTRIFGLFLPSGMNSAVISCLSGQLSLAPFVPINGLSSPFKAVMAAFLLLKGLLFVLCCQVVSCIAKFRHHRKNTLLHNVELGRNTDSAERTMCSCSTKYTQCYLKRRRQLTMQ